MSWLDRLRQGFTKTADKVADNLTGLATKAALDTSTLDDIEEALIASDIGPEASHRIREAIARQKFEKLDERGLRSILAEEIEKILAPVAKPLEIYGFPRPHGESSSVRDVKENGRRRPRLPCLRSNSSAVPLSR